MGKATEELQTDSPSDAMIFLLLNSPQKLVNSVLPYQIGSIFYWDDAMMVLCPVKNDRLCIYRKFEYILI